jgi:hypothetical protein
MSTVDRAIFYGGQVHKKRRYSCDVQSNAYSAEAARPDSNGRVVPSIATREIYIARVPYAPAYSSLVLSTAGQSMITRPTWRYGFRTKPTCFTWILTDGRLVYCMTDPTSDVDIYLDHHNGVDTLQ